MCITNSFMFGLETFSSLTPIIWKLVNCYTFQGPHVLKSLKIVSEMWDSTYLIFLLGRRNIQKLFWHTNSPPSLLWMFTVCKKVVPWHYFNRLQVFSISPFSFFLAHGCDVHEPSRQSYGTPHSLTRFWLIYSLKLN